MNKNGVSVVEIMIVAALSSMILLAATLIMGRSTRTFKKGTDMLNTQVLMDGIVDKLRSDVRSLVRLVECTDNSVEFIMITENGEETVKYVWEKDKQTLFRTDSKFPNFNFHGAGQVKSFLFQPVPDKKSFHYLNVAMQLRSDEKGAKDIKESRLSIVCQFSSKCLESDNPYGK
ncbi:MAG: hypothetical protein HQM10_14040 [Candidatus Riflebacteria bacterium]|nr:hypothetical protein [Candidatus Riflebacteria bacterium]